LRRGRGEKGDEGRFPVCFLGRGAAKKKHVCAVFQRGERKKGAAFQIKFVRRKGGKGRKSTRGLECRGNERRFLEGDGQSQERTLLREKGGEKGAPIALGGGGGEGKCPVEIATLFRMYNGIAGVGEGKVEEKRKKETDSFYSQGKRGGGGKRVIQFRSEDLAGSIAWEIDRLISPGKEGEKKESFSTSSLASRG